MKYEHVIWEGRYQPIHRGHVAYIEKLLEHAEHLWIFVVANETSQQAGLALEDLPAPEFTAVVNEHHAAEKNPLPWWLRYRLVFETLTAEFPDAPITVWGGRRLDLQWPLYARLLPTPRVFMTPERDSFEDLKAQTWHKLGEEVVRMDVSDLPKISATEVRERVLTNQKVDRLLCPTTIELLTEYGYLR